MPAAMPCRLDSHAQTTIHFPPSTGFPCFSDLYFFTGPPLLQVLEHTFNMPLQLSSPDFYDCGSQPSDAHQETLEVQEGDVVVLVSEAVGGGIGWVVIRVGASLVARLEY